MQQITIEAALDSWSEKDLKNLWLLIRPENETLPLESSKRVATIESRLKWLYHSKVIAKAVGGIGHIAKTAVAKAKGTEIEKLSHDDVYEMPRYDTLLVKAAKHIHAYEGEPSVHECEQYLSEAVIVAALRHMKPSQRSKFFTSTVALQEMTQNAGIKSPSLSGPVAAVAALGVAQASGFGV